MQFVVLAYKFVSFYRVKKFYLRTFFFCLFQSFFQIILNFLFWSPTCLSDSMKCYFTAKCCDNLYQISLNFRVSVGFFPFVFFRAMDFSPSSKWTSRYVFDPCVQWPLRSTTRRDEGTTSHVSETRSRIRSQNFLYVWDSCSAVQWCRIFRQEV